MQILSCVLHRSNVIGLRFDDLVKSVFELWHDLHAIVHQTRPREIQPSGRASMTTVHELEMSFQASAPDKREIAGSRGVAARRVLTMITGERAVVGEGEMGLAFLVADKGSLVAKDTRAVIDLAGKGCSRPRWRPLWCMKLLMAPDVVSVPRGCSRSLLRIACVPALATHALFVVQATRGKDVSPLNGVVGL